MFPGHFWQVIPLVRMVIFLGWDDAGHLKSFARTLVDDEDPFRISVEASVGEGMRTSLGFPLNLIVTGLIIIH